MAKYECSVCSFVYDESAEEKAFDELPEDWECPVCGADASCFERVSDEDGGAEGAVPVSAENELAEYLSQWRRSSDEVERQMASIHEMALSGAPSVSPMRTQKQVPSWDEILVLGAQLARLPLNQDESVNTRTVIGPRARQPLEISIPCYISHMSFGALSREAKIAMARGSAAVGTAMCSGEGGVLPDSLDSARHYIFEYVPNRYSVSAEILSRVAAVEIKIGQSAKPGMGGHLPGAKVTPEIAELRGFPAGEDIISPARFPDIRDAAELEEKVGWLREATGGKPVGVKIAAGHLEADLELVLAAGADFVTIDGRPGATGAAPSAIKDATSVPTIYALARARRFLDRQGAESVSLLVTGGFRVSADIIKALALGADAVAIASAAMMACGCQQYRVCHTGKCPVGIATQDPELRERFDVELSARRLSNFLEATTAELVDFARLSGHGDVHSLSPRDLCTTSSDISRFTGIAHAGESQQTH